MIIKSKRSWFGYGMDVFLTALGWLFFVWVFASGIKAIILLGGKYGPDAPFLPPLLLDSVGTVMGYVILMVIFTVSLLLWAKYNQFRFRGKDRRKPPLPLTRPQLLERSGMSSPQLTQAQSAQVLVVEHAEDGQLVNVRQQIAAADTPPLAAASPARVQMQVEDFYHAAETIEQAASIDDFYQEAEALAEGDSALMGAPQAALPAPARAPLPAPATAAPAWTPRWGSGWPPKMVVTAMDNAQYLLNGISFRVQPQAG